MASVRSKCVALIPARSGSKSIKDKNIAEIGGHPLLAYTIVAALRCESIDEVVVSTDSGRYAEIARGYGAKVPFLRPPEIAQDSSIDDGFFRHYYDWLDKAGVDLPELVCHLRPTTPFRQLRDIRGAIAFMRNRPEATALRSMASSELTPYKMFQSEGGWAKPFMEHEEREFYNLPRQRFPKTYIPNGVVDVLRPSELLSSGQLHGERMAIWETEWVPDIDSPSDLQAANRFFERDERFKWLGAAVREAGKRDP